MTPKNEGKARAAQPTRVTPFVGSQDLIHRNNSPESTSMRVTARFDLPEGVDLATVQKTINFAFGPLGFLMQKRAINGP